MLNRIQIKNDNRRLASPCCCIIRTWSSSAASPGCLCKNLHRLHTCAAPLFSNVMMVKTTGRKRLVWTHRPMQTGFCFLPPSATLDAVETYEARVCARACLCVRDRARPVCPSPQPLQQQAVVHTDPPLSSPAPPPLSKPAAKRSSMLPREVSLRRADPQIRLAAEWEWSCVVRELCRGCRKDTTRGRRLHTFDCFEN